MLFGPYNAEKHEFSTQNIELKVKTLKIFACGAKKGQIQLLIQGGFGARASPIPQRVWVWPDPLRAWSAYHPKGVGLAGPFDGRAAPIPRRGF